MSTSFKLVLFTLKGRIVDLASISCMSLFCALFSAATMKMASFAPNSCPVTFYALHLDENAKFWTSSLSCNIRTICPWKKKEFDDRETKVFLCLSIRSCDLVSLVLDISITLFLTRSISDCSNTLPSFSIWSIPYICFLLGFCPYKWFASFVLITF